MTPPTEVRYRYREMLFSGPFGHPAHFKLVADEFPVVRKTPRGEFVLDDDGKERFIRGAAFKKFAYPTLEEALESFIARKREQARICGIRVKQAEACIAKAKEMKSDGQLLPTKVLLERLGPVFTKVEELR